MADCVDVKPVEVEGPGGQQGSYLRCSGELFETGPGSICAHV